MTPSAIDERDLKDKEITIACLSLQLMRLLLASGSDTRHAEESVARVVRSLGFASSLLVTYESLIITVEFGGNTYTRAADELFPANVDMAMVESLNVIADGITQQSLDCASARAELQLCEERRPIYSPLALVLALGISAGSIARLFGADWTAVGAAMVGVVIGCTVQWRLRRANCGSLSTSFVSALIGALAGAFATRHAPVSARWTSLVAPGMVLVPGVPLINAIHDVISNRLSIGVARLVSVTTTLLSIGVGIFIASKVAAVQIPLMESAPGIPFWQDLLFSALATVGFICLFNVRLKIAWLPMLCAFLGHPIRTVLMREGIKIVLATFVATLAIGLASHYLALLFEAPPVTFGFPAVVTMIPGSFALRAFMGAGQIIQVSEAGGLSLVAQTFNLSLTTAFLFAAIAIGLAIPMALQIERNKRFKIPVYAATAHAHETGIHQNG